MRKSVLRKIIEFTTIFTYLIILIPSKHVYLPIFAVDIIMIYQSISLDENINILTVEFFHPFITILSIYLYLRKEYTSKLIGQGFFIIGILLFTFYSNENYFLDFYFVSLTILHLLSSFLSIRILKESKNEVK